MVDRDFRDAIGLMKGWSEASSPPPTMLIPLCDGVAYGMGHVKLQPEEECVTVHLGEDFFTQCSVADAASVVERRNWIQGGALDGGDEDSKASGSAAAEDTVKVEKEEEEEEQEDWPTPAETSGEVEDGDPTPRPSAAEAAGASVVETSEEASAPVTKAAPEPTPPARPPVQPPAPPTPLPPPPPPTPPVVDSEDRALDGFGEEGLPLFEIEEYVDEDGNEVSSRVVDVRTKIAATEKFRDSLLQSARRARGDDDGDDGGTGGTGADDGPLENQNRGSSSSSWSGSGDVSSRSEEDAMGVLRSDPLEAVDGTTTGGGGRSAGAGSSGGRPEGGRPEGGGPEGGGAVPYEETQRALEALILAEESDGVRRAENARSRVALQSSSWSKGFLGGGSGSSSSSSSSSSETQGASAKHAAKRRPGKLAAVQEQANGGDGSGGGDREDEEQARARALAPQTKPAVVAARSSARKVEGPTRVKVAEVSERAIRERSPSQQSSSSSGDVASSASAPDAKPMSRFKARRLQQKQEEQQQQGL